MAKEDVLLEEVKEVDATYYPMNLMVAEVVVAEDKDPISLPHEPYFRMFQVYSFSHHLVSYPDDPRHDEPCFHKAKYCHCYAWSSFYLVLFLVLFRHGMTLFLDLDRLFLLFFLLLLLLLLPPLFHFHQRNYPVLQK
jgi:hypothetical protein